MRPSIRRTRAKRRARRDGAGAVMFIVAMTGALLAMMGLFAITAARDETRSSGYARWNASTQSMAEFGAVGATRIPDSTLQRYVSDLMRSNVTDHDPSAGRFCNSLSHVPSTAPPDLRKCKKLYWSDLAAASQWPAGTERPGTNYPSLATGPKRDTNAFANNQTVGEFKIEITEPVGQAVAPPGEQVSGGDPNQTPRCYARVEVNAAGLTRGLQQGVHDPWFGTREMRVHMSGIPCNQ